MRAILRIAWCSGISHLLIRERSIPNLTVPFPEWLHRISWLALRNSSSNDFQPIYKCSLITYTSDTFLIPGSWKVNP